MKKLRQEFADTMLEVGRRDEKLVVMVGDISHGILQPYAQSYPNRYYNVGICEPTIVSMAAGIAKSGLIPVVHTIAPFIIERAYEQIKLDFGYQKLGVNLISVGSAFDYSQLGCSHHCYTDISLMSHFRNAQVFFPGSPIELNLLFKKVYANGHINYFRLPEYPHDHVLDEKQIIVGQAIRILKGECLTIVVIGPQLKTVLQAAEILKQRRCSADVLYFPTIKPFDGKSVWESVTRTKNVLVIEEASAHDGVFNQVLRATRDIPHVSYSQIAIDDFVHGYGSYEDLCQRLGFSVEGIIKKIKQDLKIEQ
ncbi:MAG: Transket pyr protein [Parachlamydiales bacterium]|nr:Transket pyr protein [Parachlamydiales bacterium]